MSINNSFTTFGFNFTNQHKSFCNNELVEYKRNPNFYIPKKSNFEFDNSYMLYLQLSDNNSILRIPTDERTRIQYGFTNCKNEVEEYNLAMIFYYCLYIEKRDINLFKKLHVLHNSFVQQKLFDYIVFILEDKMQCDFAKWIFDRRDIFNTLNLDSNKYGI